MPSQHRSLQLVWTVAVMVILQGWLGKLSKAEEVTEPSAILGFEPGADFKLAPWDKVVSYFETVATQSDRVVVEQIGMSTLGRPFLAAIVSGEATVADLDTYKTIQRRLADPAYLPLADETEADELINESKTVVLVTCTIHSSETASTLMACSLLYEMATRNDPAMREILDNTILVLIPSVNPDGVDIVHDWYERSKGTPWEGSGMPWLYHPYAGHDTNRDWFMLNLEETKILTRYLYNEWFPTITWDVHQMGSTGPRLFVPPFHDPINPNLDPRLNQGIFLIGAHLAADLAREGKRGVATHVMYDNWWNGGNRTVPQRHNMVGILTEAASVKLATPIFLERNDLRGGGRGFQNHDPSVTFVDPWPGGWWRIGDIAEYELICARSLLTLASRYKDWFQSNYRAMALDQIELGTNEPPFAWIVSRDQRDPGTAAKMIEILRRTGIKIEKATESFRAGGVDYPADSWILPAAQAFRPHLKDMMERQQYPRRTGPDGRPERPYDVAGWTLPLQMGVKSTTIAGPFEANTIPVESTALITGGIVGDFDAPIAFTLSNQANDDFIVINELLAADVPVGLLTRDAQSGDQLLSAGSLWIEDVAAARRVFDQISNDVSSSLVAISEPIEVVDESQFLAPLSLDLMKSWTESPRIGLYQPWRPSMDEGGTRLVLETFRFPYETIHHTDVKAGDLENRLDVLIIPSVGRRSLAEGYGPEQTEPAYVGGLEGEGVASIQQFIEAGGRVICLEDSCHYLIDELDLPVTELLSGLSPDDFFCPGSIVAVRFGAQDRLEKTRENSFLLTGVPDDGSAYFSNSLAFAFDSNANVTPICRYASTDPLQSGWLLGPEHLKGNAAILHVPYGDGSVTLFGFPPQHRGQPHGTFRPFFNAILGEPTTLVPADPESLGSSS